MISKVNSWDLVNTNWPIDSRMSPTQIAQKRQQTESAYIFAYRDEPYKHVYGGPWNLFTPLAPNKYIDTWA